MSKNIILSLASAILLALPWLIGIGGWSLLIAFVPLLILQARKPRRFGLWVALTFVLWIMASAWWVSISTMIAAAAIPVVGLFFSWIPFMIYHYVSKRQPGILSWVVLVTAWISFEALYTHQDISFPWLTLGNGFAQMPWAVQWYEITGVFGGTLWILISNILIFKAWRNYKNVKQIVIAAAWVILPMTGSVIRYATYKEVEDPLKVCIVQPNIDPYEEKFDALSQDQQTDILLNLAAEAPADVDFIITPETALDDYFDLTTLSRNARIDQFRQFIKNQYPSSTIILGTSTYQQRGGNIYRYNSAMWVDSSSIVDVYHKSKLVIGAEMIPYPAIFEMLMIDLGGVSGNLDTQPERATYDGVGVAICYESVYGSYYTEYIDKHAEVMFIITNDGWWGNTRGHHHHIHMARLRAIETRHSIARSANTGISAIINQRGDIIERVDWDVRGVINGSINKNQSITFYVKYKDYIARLSGFTLALSLLFFIGQRFRKKS